MGTSARQASGRSAAKAPRRRRDRVDVARDALQVASDAASLVHSAKRFGADLRRVITDHPLEVIGGAAGVGFVVGGGLSPVILRSVTGLASRLAMLFVTRQVLALIEGQSGSAGHTGSNSNDDSESEE